VGEASRECLVLWEDLRGIIAELPYPPRSATQVLLHAEVAFHVCDRDDDKVTLSDLTSDELERFTVARLIQAVLALLGGQRL
jgi:hypothetical protein